MIGIIAANNLRYSPYLEFYTTLLEQSAIEYEVIFPNRRDVQDVINGKTIEIPWDKKIPTALSYYIYCSKVKRIIREKNFTGLIVLTTNIAVYLAPWLKRRFANRYIVDIRDYTHENKKVFYWLERMAISHSGMNIISSKKFKVFLPRGEYYICHNISSFNEYHFRSSNHERIVIGYLGTGNYLENCKKLLELINQDDRFEFHFWGPDSIERYFAIQNIQIDQSKIFFHGKYAPSEKESILRNVDILFNVYGNGTPLLDYALSNKLYDAFRLRCPILTSPDTYMTDLGGPLAYPIDINSKTALDKLYLWYKDLNGENIEKYSHEKLQEFIAENNETQRVAKDRIISWG